MSTSNARELEAKTEVSSHYIPFDVVQEPWIQYHLSDGTRLRLRFTLLKMIRGDGPVDPGMKSANVVSQILVVTEVPASLRGSPASLPTERGVDSEIEADVEFDSPLSPPSVYRFEGARTLVVETRVTRVIRTKLFGPDGDRVYKVETTSQVVVLGGDPKAGAAGGEQAALPGESHGT